MLRAWACKGAWRCRRSGLAQNRSLFYRVRLRPDVAGRPSACGEAWISEQSYYRWLRNIAENVAGAAGANLSLKKHTSDAVTSCCRLHKILAWVFAVSTGVGNGALEEIRTPAPRSVVWISTASSSIFVTPLRPLASGAGRQYPILSFPRTPLMRGNAQSLPLPPCLRQTQLVAGALNL